jgi:VWFA-related protein
MRSGACGVVDGWRGWAAMAMLCVTLGVGAAAAQNEKVPTFHAYTNLVQLPTLVLDQARKPIIPIAESRFFVSLDGGPKFRVTHVRLEGEDPITLAVVMDLNQPFPSLMREMDGALAGLAPASLHPKDHVSVFSMGCKLLRGSSDVPADTTGLKTAVNQALAPWIASERDRHKKDCRKRFELWDSIAVAVSNIADLPGRRVVLVVTDGVDRGSKDAWNEVREYAQMHGVAIFGLVQPGDLNEMLHRGFSHQEDLFNQLCEMTGGMVLTSTPKDLEDELKWFTSLLRKRYIVEFPHPIDTKGGRHEMEVTVENLDAFIRPSGIGVPVDSPSILNDPMTVPSDPSRVPRLGKRTPMTSH